jgi:hypothetical protein
MGVERKNWYFISTPWKDKIGAMPSNIFDPSITARFMFLVERLPSHLFLQVASYKQSQVASAIARSSIKET